MIKVSRILKRASGYSNRAWVKPDLSFVVVHGDEDEDLHSKAATREGLTYTTALQAGWVKVGLVRGRAYLEYKTLTDAQLHTIQKYFIPLNPRSVEAITYPNYSSEDFDPAEEFYMINHASDLMKRRSPAYA